jgi:hypothetical protein
MLDSTRHPPLAARTLALLVSLLVAVTMVGLWGAGPARADGDPASDVLATQPLFLAQDAGFTAAGQAQLAAELAAAQRGGSPLRVAVIAASADLGSVTALWRRPVAYARFLDQELSRLYDGPLLVVMPNGLGVAGSGAGANRLARVVGRTAPGGATPPGGAATTQARPHLQHVTLSAVTGFLQASGQGVSVGVARTGVSTGQTDVAAIAALAIGTVLIALCWGLSLRARPPGSRLTHP